MSETQSGTRRAPLPPLIYVAGIALAILLNWLYPLPWITAPLSDILFAAGFLVLAAAVALFVGAVRAMRRARTTLDPNGTPEHLVTTGPYAVTRNPIYLANTLILIGIGLVSGITWFLPLALGCAYATAKLAIVREEAILTTRFGKKYRDYAKRVRRWL